MSHRIFLLDEVLVLYNLHCGVSGVFFHSAKLRTLVYVIIQKGRGKDEKDLNSQSYRLYHFDW